MTWNELIQQKRVAPEPADKQELDALRALAQRNLEDAALAGLSADGRFGMAYNAARTLATVAVRAAGYRVRQIGGAHYNTFVALEAAIGPGIAAFAAYLDNCRIKRNQLSYDAANVVSESDGDELLVKAKEVRRLVEEWIRRNHPSLADRPPGDP